MTLAEIRNEIDRIDTQIKELFLARMEAARNVAEVKYGSGDEIYKSDREKAVITRLIEDVAPELKEEYTAVIRKIMEAARKYEYGLIYDWDPSAIEPLFKSVEPDVNDRYVKVHLTRPDCCNSMSSILSMIGDYGFNMKQMILLEENTEDKTVKFELVICGNLQNTAMRKLVYQLWKESLAFEVLESC